MIISHSELRYILASDSKGKMVLDHDDDNPTQMPTLSESSGKPQEVEYKVVWEMSCNYSWIFPSARKATSN